MKCENCGAPINKDTKICPYCNQYNSHYVEKEIESTLIKKEIFEVNEQEKKKNTKNRKMSKYVSMIVFFLVLLFIFNSFSHNNLFSNGKMFIVVVIIIASVIFQFRKDSKKKNK